ncbi:hypothetical protein GGR27_002374 [Lewinella antarctica]|uniref:Secreted protein n=1 Tax=Neolewinella antarctica TaxID=442734 RepID=A0ABX0XD91_9BACT|nr:hypothetical protein [Neolewinella antarctica]
MLDSLKSVLAALLPTAVIGCISLKCARSVYFKEFIRCVTDKSNNLHQNPRIRKNLPPLTNLFRVN